ncbi:MAG: hypothetical protein IPJ77_22895 [Planctomycetes bacterium]|nr:hypothetical protein [Planctomycetota bacterium]
MIVTWTGADSEREDARFFPLTSASEFDAMWTDAVIRHGSSRWPTDHLHPRPDFSNCIGFAWTAGTTWNTRGYDVRSIERVGDEWHVRLAPITYQSLGEGDRVRPYVIVLMQREPGATIVVDEDVRDLIDAPPQWKERGRVTTPKLAGALVPVAPPETERFAPAVLAAVRDYDRFKRISDLPAWSPLLCQAPPTGGALVSASEDGGTHGSKLYHLFAKDAAAYDAAGDDLMKSVGTERTPSTPADPAPIGQVLVKEAWRPVPIDLPAPRADGTRELPDSVRSSRGFGLAEDCATRDGVLYRKGAQAELYVLMKLDPSTPDTDRGWVYATVTPDRKRVTAAGRIESCMHCHEDATHDRQFGLPFDWVTMRQPPR